jgi:monoamine oxidase
MLAKTEGLESKIKKNHWVTKVSLLKDKTTGQGTGMKVEYDIKDLKTTAKADKVKAESAEYSAVINTTTLGALQKIDLTDLALPYGMKTAIRVLRYDSSTKVGIRFKKMWWRDAEFLPGRAIKGGVAKTDMPLRVWLVFLT